MVNYVDQIIPHGEKLLYRCRIHPVVLLPGLAFCFLSALIFWYLNTLEYYIMEAPEIEVGGYQEYFAHFNYAMAGYYYDLLYEFPETKTLILWLSGILLAVGIVLDVRAILVMTHTELAVTDRRIILKHGVTSVTTTELDRWKLAEVIIHQSPAGRIFNYGNVLLRGFSGMIGGLPPISSPYELQRHLAMRYQW